MGPKRGQANGRGTIEEINVVFREMRERERRREGETEEGERERGSEGWREGGG